MPSNIEIKARDRDPARTKALVEELSGTPAVVLEQHDTFFPCPHGRLKLRQLSPGEGELIFYRRADVAGTKQSDYEIVPISSPASMAAVLGAALGTLKTVVKTRLLFRIGQTRVHLDTVVDLGSFVELEVVLHPGQPASEGHRIAKELMDRLGIRDNDLLDGAYADLIASQPNK